MRSPLFITALISGVMASAPLSADVVKLKNGGTLRGTVSSEAKARPSVIQVTLLSGAVITLHQDEIAELTKRPLKFEQYEARRRDMEDTLAAHWDLAEWCRQNNLTDERRPHLERVLDFDPEHKQAHYALGHTLQDGEWLSKAEFEARKREAGYVKFNGKFVPIDQLETLQAQAAQTKAERDWYPKVRLWLSWATSDHAQRSGDGLANLRNIRQQEAMAALVQFLAKSKQDDVRQLFIEIAARIGGSRAALSLSLLAVRDENRLIREQALDAIPADQQNVAQAVMIRALRDPANPIVRQAGVALAKIGNAEAVPPLIRALVTKHRFIVKVPVPTVGFRSDGGFAGPVNLPPEILAGLRAGQFPNGVIILPPPQKAVFKEVPVSIDIENEEVLLALRKLAEQDFGFDENAWTRWWNVEKHQSTVAPDLP